MRRFISNSHLRPGIFLILHHLPGVPLSRETGVPRESLLHKRRSRLSEKVPLCLRPLADDEEKHAPLTPLADGNLQKEEEPGIFIGVTWEVPNRGQATTCELSKRSFFCLHKALFGNLFHECEGGTKEDF
ncbi:hypothetical protein YC2023_045173 [Brassica napus]